MGDPIGERPRSHGADAASLKQFTGVMAEKLRANAHKAHWSTVGNGYLLMRLAEEAEELAAALKSYRRAPSHETSVAVIHECADVANFAMMIADNARYGRGQHG